MDINFLDANAGSRGLDHRIGGLIAAIGTCGFDNSLLDLAAVHQIRCSHITAFAQEDRGAPRVVLAADRNAPNLARQIALKYIALYWQLDPANSLIQTERRAGAGSTMHLRYEEIENASYQRDCYRFANLVDRFSIIKQHGLSLFRINFYRDNTRGYFTENDIKQISDLACLLIQIIAKHEQERPSQNDEERLDRYCNRLNTVSHALSNREMQVCAEIVLGRSSDAIARKLGLSINTVLTHRKRAYSKLQISSQNELSKIVLQ
jgi:LuxR family transcriptional regulator, activator of tox operons